MELLSGFSECQLDDLRGRLVGEKVYASELNPEFVQYTLDIMEDVPDDKLEYPRPYDINQVLQDLAGFCQVCSLCSYITDANRLDADGICESCHQETYCPLCEEFYCQCSDKDDDLYGFEDSDFDDDDNFEDEMLDFEGDDWEDDFEDDE